MELTASGGMRNYPDIIRKVPVILERVASAYDADNFQMATDLTRQIGSLYAPSDNNAAERIAYLLQMTASTMYFRGINYQVTKQVERRFNQS